MMTLLNMLCALNARLYMITKTVSRAAVEDVYSIVGLYCFIVKELVYGKR